MMTEMEAAAFMAAFAVAVFCAGAFAVCVLVSWLIGGK